MIRLFRRPEGGARSYAALGLFAAAYLAALALVLAPGVVRLAGALTTP